MTWDAVKPPSLKEVRRPPERTTLRFTPTAWAKLQTLCHAGFSEIGAFGISAADDALLIEEVITVKQSCTEVSVCFDDAAVADFFEEQVDRGRRPEQFARVWLHTHPGSGPNPSSTDEETFMRVFGKCDWAIMCIVARTGQTYARLRFNIGPGGHLELPVEVDYSQPFGSSDHETWLGEYTANVQVERFIPELPGAGVAAAGGAQSPSQTLDGDAWFGWMDDLDPWERQLLIEDGHLDAKGEYEL